MGVPSLTVLLRLAIDFTESDLELALMCLVHQRIKSFSVVILCSGERIPSHHFLRGVTADRFTISVKRLSDVNTVIRTQTSRYIAFLDCGQTLHSGAYSDLIKELEVSHSGIAFGNSTIIDSKRVAGISRQVRTIQSHPPCSSLTDLWTDGFCPLHACMFNREQLVAESISFRTDLGSLADYVFIIDASTRLKSSFNLTHKKLALYHIVNSVSQVLAIPSMARHCTDFAQGIIALQRVKLRSVLSNVVKSTLEDRPEDTIALYLSKRVSKSKLTLALYHNEVTYQKRNLWLYLNDKLSGRHSSIKRSEQILSFITDEKPMDMLTGVSEDLGRFDLYKLIAKSGLFDSRFYLKKYSDSWSHGVAPLRHYIVWGGLEGRSPSERFDSPNYLSANPDIPISEVAPLAHYLETGISEGRPMYPQQFEVERSLRTYISKREKVLLVSHDGSRTGAPMVAYNLLLHLQKDYDVIMLFLGGGPLVEASRHVGALVLGPVTLDHNSPTAVGLIYAIAKLARPRFAIVNSVASRAVIPPLFASDIPVITLVHEFAADTRPIGAFLEVVQGSSATVFSTTLAIDNMLEFHPELRARLGEYPLIPQGQCYIPKDKKQRFLNYIGDNALTKLEKPKGFPSSGITVVGLGTIYYRKGVDLFLDCAFRMKRDYPGVTVRFIWVGSYVHGEPSYRMFIEDQIKRADLSDSIHFINQLDSLDAVYKEADLLFLSSRLDPLPNVAIDALLRGVPCLVFERTTGIADLLKKHGLDEYCVAPYLDTAVMAKKIAALAASPVVRRDLGVRSQAAAAEMFSARRYCEQLVELAEIHVTRFKERETEIQEIALARIINPDFVCGLNTEKEMAAAYLRSSKVWYAKPFPGFHPGVYRELNSSESPLKHDPLIEFMRAGRPSGPWLQNVLSPTSNDAPYQQIKDRVALHIHAYYPDMLPGILKRLHLNQNRMDLLISVPSKDALQKAEAFLKEYSKGSVVIRQVLNKGRDIGPFLTSFRDDILKYNIIGHIHTKKSTHADKNMIQRWVYALMENTLGGHFPMADLILNAMDRDPNLGMVFPDDPNCHPWGSSYTKGMELAKRLNLPTPAFEINFPVGTMFWARVEALRPLFALDLTWTDYPEEPVPIDGTILHAIERLLPLVVQSTGKSLAVTYIPGVTRLR